jgi:hypothetical protein
MTDSLTSHPDIRSTCKLIVLFPASAPVSPDQANRIWEIARSKQVNVLLLGLTNDFGEESQLRRKLITMAAIIRYPGVSTDLKVEHGTDWVRQVKRIWQAGDIIACYEDQKLRFNHKSLDQVLRSKLNVPIYMLSGYEPTTNPNSIFWSRVAFWSGSLALIGVFLWAEQKVIELPQDWAHTLLIYLFIFVEFGLLWLWNSLFS